MARIRTYELDNNITTNDYLLGNDGDNGSIITKRFGIEELREFFLRTAFSADDAPAGFIPTVTQEGGAIERSPLRVIHTAVTQPIALTVDGEVGGVQAFYQEDQNGNATIYFDNYDEEYYLPDFVGTTFTFQSTLYRGETFTSEVTAYNGFEMVGNIYRDSFSVSSPSNINDFPDLRAVNELTSLTASRGTEVSVNLEGNLSVTGDFDVEGNSSLNTLEVSGESNFESTASFDSGLSVGEPPVYTITPDGEGGVVIDGDVTNTGNHTFTESINAEGGIRTPQGEVRPVFANNEAGTANRAILNKLQIGDQVYPLAATSENGIIEALPGVSEIFEGTTQAITAGRFFYGIEQGNQALFEEFIANEPTGINIAADQRTATVPNTYQHNDPNITATANQSEYTLTATPQVTSNDNFRITRTPAAGGDAVVITDGYSYNAGDNAIVLTTAEAQNIAAGDTIQISYDNERVLFTAAFVTNRPPAQRIFFTDTRILGVVNAVGAGGLNLTYTLPDGAPAITINELADNNYEFDANGTGSRTFRIVGNTASNDPDGLNIDFRPTTGPGEAEDGEIIAGNIDLFVGEPTRGEPQIGIVYEIIAYDQSTGEFTFGRLGSGDFYISTDQFFLQGLRPDDGRPGNSVLLIDNDSGEVFSSGSGGNNIPTFRGLTVTDNNQAPLITNPLESIEIRPASAVTTTNGVVTIDIEGGFDFGGAITTTTGPGNLVAGNIYALLPLTGSRTLTLPLGQEGDTIRISMIIPDDLQIPYYRIQPNTAQTIMRLSGTQLERSLILNVKSQFDLVYTDADNGWVII